MHDPNEPERRAPADRRHRPTRPWDTLRTPGRRHRHRRAGDLAPGVYRFVDRYSSSLWALIILLLLMTLVDGIVTLVLLIDGRAEEANPLMALLIERDPLSFVVIKYAMTAVGLPVLLLFKDHRLFGTRFLVVYLFPAFVALYLILFAYQVALLRADPGGPGPFAASAGRPIRGDTS